MPVFSFELDQEEMHFHHLLTRRPKFQHLKKKMMDAVIDRLEETRCACGYRSELGSWKRSNRSAQKNWARHERRIKANLKPLDPFDLYVIFLTLQLQD